MLSCWNSRQQIRNCHINSEIKGNIYKLFDKFWYWKLQKVTGNSTLRTYEKFGNTLWFAPILVRKGDYFLILCENYSKILITVIMTKAVLRSTVNR